MVKNGRKTVTHKCLEPLGASVSTMVLSHHVWTLHNGISRVFLTEVINWDNNWAPHNSKRGMDNCLTGATRVFAVTRAQVGSYQGKWLLYKMAAYACVDASQNP